MSRKKYKIDPFNRKDAASLAAGSVMDFFKKHKWKMISFFPNAPCASSLCPLKKKNLH